MISPFHLAYLLYAVVCLHTVGSLKWTSVTHACLIWTFTWTLFEWIHYLWIALLLQPLCCLMWLQNIFTATEDVVLCLYVSSVVFFLISILYSMQNNVSVFFPHTIAIISRHLAHESSRLHKKTVNKSIRFHFENWQCKSLYFISSVFTATMTALTFRKNSLIGPCIWASITRYKPSWLQSDFFCLVTLQCEHLMGGTSVSIICGFNCTLGSKWCPCRHVQLNPGTISLCSGEITVFKQVSWELPQSSIGQTNRNSCLKLTPLVESICSAGLAGAVKQTEQCFEITTKSHNVHSSGDQPTNGSFIMDATH